MKTKQKNSKFIRHILLPMLFLFAIAAATSCGGGGNGGASSDGGGNSGGGGSTTSGVGPGGGTVAGPYGAQVIVPAGALASTVDIVIARESANAPDFPPNGIAAVGATYEITPHGTPFAHLLPCAFLLTPHKFPPARHQRSTRPNRTVCSVKSQLRWTAICWLRKSRIFPISSPPPAIPILNSPTPPAQTPGLVLSMAIQSTPPPARSRPRRREPMRMETPS